MSHGHPSAGMLRRFMLGELPQAEMRRVLRHLLTRCPQCRLATRPLWVLDETVPAPLGAAAALAELPERPEEELGLETGELSAPAAAEYPEYDAVFDRVLARIASSEQAMAKERAQGDELLRELLHHLPAHQRLLVSNSARFRHRALCELLLVESHEAGSRDVQQALSLARLAVEVASQLDERASGGAELLNGLRARAWAQVGNALRINAEHPEAEVAFANAETLFSGIDGIGLVDRARVLDLKASLRKDQRRFGEASRLLDRVLAIYEKLGQSHLLGRALSQKATVCGEAGQVEAEIVFLRHALDLIDPEEDVRVFLNARHNLIVALHESGRSREAFALLFHTRPLYLKLGDRMSLLRLRWLEGRVALGLDRLEQAAAAFCEVREALAEMGRDYDAAEASLDVAKALTLQGRTVELRRLAEEMLAALATRNIHREALAALACFWTAAAREQASLGLVGEVAGFLQVARNNPGLPFVRRTAADR